MDGPVVVVTGAARGIGRWVARTFAEAGARLAVADPVLDALVAEMDLRKGFMPAGLFRGLDKDTPTIVAKYHTITSHAHLSDEDAYEIVKAIDEHPDCLQE